MRFDRANVVKNVYSGELYDVVSFDGQTYKLRMRKRDVVVLVTSVDFKRKYVKLGISEGILT